MMTIVSPGLSEKETKQELESIRKLIESAKGEIYYEDIWGSKELSYTIKGNEQGFYAVFYFNCNPQGIALIEKELYVDQNLLRYMIISVVEKYDPQAEPFSLPENEDRRGKSGKKPIPGKKEKPLDKKEKPEESKEVEKKEEIEVEEKEEKPTEAEEVKSKEKPEESVEQEEPTSIESTEEKKEDADDKGKDEDILEEGDSSPIRQQEKSDEKKDEKFKDLSDIDKELDKILDDFNNDKI